MKIHKSLPKLDLNVTNRCNFRCVHCAFNSGVTEIDEFSVYELEKILRDTRDLGGKKIDITGGEPTIRKDVDEIIKIGKSLDYKIELVTNGSLVTKEQLRYFRDLGLDSIAVSLDGSSYEVYNKIRKVDEKTYRKVLGTIDDSVELGFYTKVNTVAFNSNLNDLPRIAELCIEKKVDENGIYYFTPVGRGSGVNELAIEPIKWLEFIRKNLNDSKIKVSIEVPLIEKDFPKKGLGCILEEDPYHLQILPDGNVYPCAILASYNKQIANLHDVSIKSVWNNQNLWKEYHQNVACGVFKNGSCVDFNAFDLNEYKEYRFVCPLRKFKLGELK